MNVAFSADGTASYDLDKWFMKATIDMKTGKADVQLRLP